MPHQCSVTCDNWLYPLLECDGGAERSKMPYQAAIFSKIHIDTQFISLPCNCPTSRLVVIRTGPHRTVYVRIVEGDVGLPLFSDNAWRYVGMIQGIGEIRLRARESGVIHLNIGPATKMEKTIISVSDLCSTERIEVVPFNPSEKICTH